MNTLNGNKLPTHEKVTHVAFGCGCVRTFHVKHPAEAYPRCNVHGDSIVSTTEEYLPRKASAA